MDAARIHDLSLGAGALLLAVAAIGGLLALAGEIQVRMRRRNRFANAPALPMPTSEGLNLVEPVKNAFRRIGQQTAVRDQIGRAHV